MLVNVWQRGECPMPQALTPEGLPDPGQPPTVPTEQEFLCQLNYP